MVNVGVRPSHRGLLQGKFRAIHDGGGLGSPGRWRPAQRKAMKEAEGIELSAVCRKEYLRWTLKTEKDDGGVKALFFKLAAGKLQQSPFADDIDRARKEVDRCLVRQGRSPARQEDDVEARSAQETGGDGGGHRRQGLRVPPRGRGEGSDPRRRSRSFHGAEGLRGEDVVGQGPHRGGDATEMGKQLRLGGENAADIARQIKEDLETGLVERVSEEEAKRRYGERLAVAALGAVPKELGSSTVRLIHDGAYSVQVNGRIKVKDRLRFPLIDDATAILNSVHREANEGRGGIRGQLLYGVKGAHRLLPVCREDWGLQALRLPGEMDPGAVYLHKRGTFGIASAAYWWQRCIAAMVRTGHRLCGAELQIYHLLFADDGWMVATESSLASAPLLAISAGAGGDPAQLEEGARRSESSMDWLHPRHRELHEGHLAEEGRVARGLGQEACGSGGIHWQGLEVGFGPAQLHGGALQQVRPLLGPLYAWSSVLKGGT